MSFRLAIGFEFPLASYLADGNNVFFTFVEIFDIFVVARSAGSRASTWLKQKQKPKAWEVIYTVWTILNNSWRVRLNTSDIIINTNIGYMMVDIILAYII